jgi:DNA-binding CsgD family transcriptional regulator
MASPLTYLPLALLDEIDSGLIVCDGYGQVRFVNQAARQELAAGVVLQRVDGALRRAPQAEGDLESALREASRHRRRSLVRLSGEREEHRLMVSVQPLELPGEEPGHTLVMLGRRVPCSELGLELLAGSFGLTLAERRVLGALMREATPREIAREHAVAMSTVRTQITAIRNKLGTRRLEGLLLRTAQLPPLTCALRQGFGDDRIFAVITTRERGTLKTGVLEPAPA